MATPAKPCPRLLQGVGPSTAGIEHTQQDTKTLPPCWHFWWPRRLAHCVPLTCALRSASSAAPVLPSEPASWQRLLQPHAHVALAQQQHPPSAHGCWPAEYKDTDTHHMVGHHGRCLIRTAALRRHAVVNDVSTELHVQPPPQVQQPEKLLQRLHLQHRCIERVISASMHWHNSRAVWKVDALMMCWQLPAASTL